MKERDDPSAGTERHELLDSVLAAIEIEPEWTVRFGDGAGLLLRELGVWLTVAPQPWPALLHVEIQLARDVDLPTAQQYCVQHNTQGSLGRWVLDRKTRALALVADVPLGGVSWSAAVVAEIVVHLTTVAEVAASASPPGSTVRPPVAGRRRPSPHPRFAQIPPVLDPRALFAEPAQCVMVVVQDGLILTMLPWQVSNEVDASICLADDGSRLIARAEQHPLHGWGVGITLTPESTVPPDEAARWVAALNRSESDQAVGGAALGAWSLHQEKIVHRMFLPIAVLDAAGPLFEPVGTVRDTMLAAAARADDALLRLDPPDGVAPVLHRPSWPGADGG